MKNIANNIAYMRDNRNPLEERKNEYAKMQAAMMNPIPEADFDPATFEPMSDHPDIEIGRRERVNPGRRLETMGMYPKKIIPGQMIGMYECNQDLYLLIAHLYNRVADLEERLDNQQPTPPNGR